MVRAASAVIAAGLLVAASPPAGDGTGAIIIYRGGSVVGAAIGCPVRYEGKRIVELGRGRKARFVVAPGRYILNNKTSSIEVNVAPGETRYVRCVIGTGMLGGRAELQIVDEASYARLRDDLRAVGPSQPIR